MQLKNTLLLFLVLCFVGNTQAQDRHFTLYNFSPANLNPALAGAFEGTARIGGIYRGQGAFTDFTSGYSPSFATYHSPSFYADAPILTVRKRDWVSVGVDFLRNQAGELKYGEQWFKTMAAYHLSLDKKRNSVLSAGVRWGAVTRMFDHNAANPETNEAGVFSGISDRFNKTRFQDWGGGLMLRTKLNKAMRLELGIAADHVTTPGDNRNDNISNNQNTQNQNPRNNAANGYNYITNQDTSTVGGGQPNLNTIRRVPQPFLWTVHGRFDVQLNDQLSMAPSFMIQTTRATPAEAVLQVPFGFTFNEENNQVLHAGLGYRLGDAMQVLFGYDYKDFKFGLSYDLTLSTMNEAVSGGFEIAAAYIIKIYKEPKVEPAILCPRF